MTLRSIETTIADTSRRESVTWNTNPLTLILAKYLQHVLYLSIDEKDDSERRLEQSGQFSTNQTRRRKVFFFHIKEETRIAWLFIQ